MPALKWFAKVYDSSGTFKRVLDSEAFTGVPTIVRETGKPASDVSFMVAFRYDTSPVSVGDRVKLYCVRKTNPDGTAATGTPQLYYQGNVEEPTLVLDQNGGDNVTVRLFPIDAMLNRAGWKNGTYAFTLSAQDPSAMIGAAIDDVNATFGSFFTKNLTSSGQSLDLKVTASKHLKAIQDAAALLPDGWLWRVEPDGTVTVMQWPAPATHAVTFGTQVDSILLVNSLVDTVNHVVVVWGAGPTYTEYSDAGSIALYGKRTLFVNDSSITTLAASDARGASELGAKNPSNKTELVVNSNYLNETIQPGDTLKVLNVPASMPFNAVNRIVRVQYDGSLAVIQLAEVFNVFSSELEKFINA